MTTYDDYVPKFRIGEFVTANAGLDKARDAVITERAVYRSRAKGPNSYYNLSDGTGAWESSLQLVTERVAPEVATARIVSTFNMSGMLRESVATSTYVESAESWTTEIRLTIYRTYVYFRALSGDREVTTTAQWQWQVGPGEPTWADNLGSAIVSAYNASLALVGAQ